MPLRIKSLEELKQWNQNPTPEKPIVLEWFLDWFFKLLDDGNETVALDALEQLVVFGEKCEGYSRRQSEEVTVENLAYFSNYAMTRWPRLLNKLYEKVDWIKDHEPRRNSSGGEG